MTAPSLINRITNFVDAHQLIPEQATIILGLSGGPDSVFLFHYLLNAQQSRPFKLIVAHLNHGWRSTAGYDEQFCRDLALRCGIPSIIEHAAALFKNISWTGSKEEQARVARRIFFERIAAEHTNARIALAHHQDDQDETFFIRLVRGAGLQGLKGMAPRAGIYIRPLLCARKEELLTYLEEHNLAYVLDSTNVDDTYLRNRIRHRVIPALRLCDQRFPGSLQQVLTNLAEADEFCTILAERTLQQLSQEAEDAIWIDLAGWQKLHPFLQKQVLLSWLCKAQVVFTPSQGLFYEIMRFLNQAQPGKHLLYGRWYIQKQQQRARIIGR